LARVSGGNSRPPDATTAALLQRGLHMHQAGKLVEARKLYALALERAPDNFDALHLAGVAAYQAGDLATAHALIDEALARNPHHPHAHSNRGSVLRDLGQLDAALSAYDRALELRPDLAEFHYNRANALADLDRLDEALASFDRALGLRPDYAEAHCNRGGLLWKHGRPEAALAAYEQAIEISPQHAEALGGKGVVLLQLKRFEAALAAYGSLINARPTDLDAHLGRATAHIALKQFGAGLAAAEAAQTIAPESAAAHLAVATAQLFMGRGEASLDSAGVAISLSPEGAEGYAARGRALLELKQYSEAIVAFDRAIAIAPNSDAYRNARLLAAIWICDWSGFAEAVAAIPAQIASGVPMDPFLLLPLVDSPALHLAATRAKALRIAAMAPGLGPIERRPPHRRLRIGYFSADFRNHATSYLMAGLFEQHDHERVEISGFAFGPSSTDAMRKRHVAAFDNFTEVRRNSPAAIATLAREMELDIAVDLHGYTTHNRSEIFAHRAAPIQVNFLGYPGSLGADYIDYMVADQIVIPAVNRAHYSEKLAFMPHSYQVNDRRRGIAGDTPARREHGLPEAGFVFCCFNNNFKITPPVFDVWMRLLGRVGGSALWLLEDSPDAARNLRREAARRGIDPSRLVFAGRVPLEAHLARHRRADLFLDTLPCAAHTTASDALWAGLPVLTVMGQSFASRVGASLLNAVGLPELITTTLGDYEDLAVALATDPARLAVLGDHLAANRLTLPLFNTTLFARHIEDAYFQMYERYQSGLPPADIIVAP
jgi:predicted O-linked N-acetylglucosamine transferase (SPINDLY family)